MMEATTTRIASFGELADGLPHAARAADLDLVVVRIGEEVHVLFGRCPHRGAKMAEGCLVGGVLTCKAHGWDFAVATGESPGVEGERLARFTAYVDRDADEVRIDEAELRTWKRANPQAFEESELLDGGGG